MLEGVEDMANGWSTMARGGGKAEMGALLQGEGFARYRAREGTTCPLSSARVPSASCHRVPMIVLFVQPGFFLVSLWCFCLCYRQQP